MWTLFSEICLLLADVVCFGFILRGLMQYNKGRDKSLIACNAVVREVRPKGPFTTEVVVTMNMDEAVLRVECELPGPWFSRRKPQPTDIVPVLWKPGEVRAIAQQTIADGKTMMLIGAIGMVITAIIGIIL